MIEQIIPGEVPVIAAIGLGLVGLGLGIAFGRIGVQDSVDKAKKLMGIAIAYERRADDTYARTRALVEPTQMLPTVQLLAATATPVERLTETAAHVAERLRDMVTRTPVPQDWAEGEMTAAFRAITADLEEPTPAPAAWVHPLAPGRPAAPPIVHAPREIMPAPRRVSAPLPAPDAPTRAHVRRSEGPGLTGRARLWGGSLLGAVPPLALPPEITPFRMPVPRQRLPHDPRRMAMLADDSTRQWRVKVVDA